MVFAGEKVVGLTAQQFFNVIEVHGLSPRGAGNRLFLGKIEKLSYSPQWPKARLRTGAKDAELRKDEMPFGLNQIVNLSLRVTTQVEGDRVS
jgi:hypothetical protein